MKIVKACIGVVTLSSIWILSSVSTAANGPVNRSTLALGSAQDPTEHALDIQQQKSDIERAEREVTRLSEDLTRARQKLTSLEAAAVPPSRRYKPKSTKHAIVCSVVSGLFAACVLKNTVGFEPGDTVAFERRDADNHLVATGIGVVRDLDSDSLEIDIISYAPGLDVEPEDELYIINRDDSPFSMATYGTPTSVKRGIRKRVR